MSQAIDHEKKAIHDSIGLIAHEDSFQLLFDLMKEMYHRRELCRAAYEMRINSQINELSIQQLEYHNDRIKKLLKL